MNRDAVRWTFAFLCGTTQAYAVALMSDGHSALGVSCAGAAIMFFFADYLLADSRR